MKQITTNFNRYETKYLITEKQMQLIINNLYEKIISDEYGKSTICNLYYDTPDYLLIRRSCERPEYKEKLRLRSYGVAIANSPVFAEIKKKYDGVVYKRRIKSNELSAMLLLKGNTKAAEDSQIKREIDFFVKRYEKLEPKVFISYEREAFYSKDDDTFRITFDKNILWRENDLTLSGGVYGNPILPKGKILMEVKCSGAMPLWFTEILSKEKIYKTSFSKYARAYETIVKEKSGGKQYA